MVPAPVHYTDESCEMAISVPTRGVVLLTITGHDVGSFGHAPMADLERLLGAEETIELFIDARRTKGASVDVSSDWAGFLGANRHRFSHINMLTGSRFIEITASFVRRFSGLENVMRIYTDPAAFDDSLMQAINRETSR